MTYHPAIASVLTLCLAAWPAAGQPLADNPDLPPGLAAARLLPGWTDHAGNRVLALELELEPGWKTYWRSPGDTGLPPQFDWQGSRNLRDVTLHWPAPQPIRSGGSLEMGYRDRLVLPMTARPATAGQPVDVRVTVDLGLCEDICVPGHLRLEADGPGAAPDPAITDALAAEPRRLDLRPACRVSSIGDGLRVAVDLPQVHVDLAAVELVDQPEIWVSSAEIVPSSAGPQAVVEMVGPTGRPFTLDSKALRLTLVGDAGAVEMTGCDRQG